MKRFLYSNALLALQPFISKAVSYVIIPLYTLHLTPEEFGSVEYVLAVGVFFKAFISMSTTTSFWKFITEKSEHPSGQVIYSVLVIPFVLGTTILVFLVLLHWTDADLVSRNLIVYCISEILSMLYLVVTLVIRQKFNALQFIIVNALYATTFIASSYLFVGRLGMKEEGVFYSYLATGLVVGMGSARVMWNQIVPVFSWPLTKEIVRYSYPLMLTNLVAITATFSDRLLLTHMKGEEELGLYMYGVKFSALLRSLFIDVFFIVWNPLRWKIYHLENGKEIFGLLSRLLFAVFLVGGFVASSASWHIGNQMASSPQYVTGLVVVPIGTFAHVFYAMYYFSIMGLLFASKTRLILYISLLAVAVNLVTNMLLIPVLGFKGCAVALLISNAAMFVVGSVLSQRYYPVIPSRKRNIALIVAYCAYHGSSGFGWPQVNPDLLNGVFLALAVVLNIGDFKQFYSKRLILFKAVDHVS